jgi:hypothetical protein
VKKNEEDKKNKGADETWVTRKEFLVQHDVSQKENICVIDCMRGIFEGCDRPIANQEKFANVMYHMA